MLSESRTFLQIAGENYPNQFPGPSLFYFVPSIVYEIFHSRVTELFPERKQNKSWPNCQNLEIKIIIPWECPEA